MTERGAFGAAQHWSNDVAGVEHVRNGENSTWRVMVDGVPRALRFTDEQHRTRSQIEAELDFVSYLARSDLRVARPLRLPSGEPVLDASTITTTGVPTYAVMFDWLDGRHYEYHSPDVDRPLLLMWGKTMAKLHEMSRTFVPSRAPRSEWRDDAVAGCDLRGVTIHPRTAALRDELVAWLEDATPDPAHYGMIHGDFERSNFLLDGEEIALFDFDDCCRHWFAWDIACALWVFRNDPADTRARLLEWFLEGYATVKEPDQRRMERFSDLVRLRTIALLLHRLRRGTTEPSAREWIARNEAWLHSPWRW